MNSIYNRTDEEFSVIGEVQANFIANDPLYQQGFKAGAASRDAEVAEHIEEITALKEVIKHGDAQRERDMELAGEERDQLRAQINVLRELVIHSTDYPPVATETTKAPEPCRANDSRRIGLGASASRLIDSISEIKRIKLCTICARLGFTMTAEFVESLGFRPVGHDKNAKLYSETQFLEICEALIQHISKQANAERSE